jgi:hypothetical protein
MAKVPGGEGRCLVRRCEGRLVLVLNSSSIIVMNIKRGLRGILVRTPSAAAAVGCLALKATDGDDNFCFKRRRSNSDNNKHGNKRKTKRKRTMRAMFWLMMEDGRRSMVARQGHAHLLLPMSLRHRPRGVVLLMMTTKRRRAGSMVVMMCAGAEPRAGC